MTALRDPLMGLGFEAETGDELALDYKGQPREKNGRFTYGKLSGNSTAGKKHGKINSVEMSRKEKNRVSSGILTDHPHLQPGEESDYFYGDHYYQFTVVEPGTYRFTSRIPIEGNKAYINGSRRGKG